MVLLQPLNPLLHFILCKEGSPSSLLQSLTPCAASNIVKEIISFHTCLLRAACAHCGFFHVVTLILNNCNDEHFLSGSPLLDLYQCSLQHSKLQFFLLHTWNLHIVSGSECIDGPCLFFLPVIYLCELNIPVMVEYPM